MRALCPHCKKWIQGPERLAGKKVACPNCRQSVRFEAPGADGAKVAIESPQEPTAAPRTSPGAAAERPAPKDSAADSGAKTTLRKTAAAAPVVSPSDAQPTSHSPVPPSEESTGATQPPSAHPTTGRVRKVSQTVSKRWPTWQAAIIAWSCKLCNGTRPVLIEPVQYYVRQLRTLPKHWWQMGGSDSLHRNRELRFPSSKYLESDTWELELPAACITCGHPTDEEGVTVNRVVTAPYVLSRALIGAAVGGLLLIWFLGWRYYPLAIPVGLWLGYRNRIEQPVVLKLRRCAKHAAEKRYPEMLIAPASAQDAADEVQESGGATHQTILVVRAGHARFKRFCEELEELMNRPPKEYVPPALPAVMPIDDTPRTIPLDGDEPPEITAAPPLTVQPAAAQPQMTASFTGDAAALATPAAVAASATVSAAGAASVPIPSAGDRKATPQIGEEGDSVPRIDERLPVLDAPEPREPAVSLTAAIAPTAPLIESPPAAVAPAEAATLPIPSVAAQQATPQSVLDSQRAAAERQAAEESARNKAKFEPRLAWPDSSRPSADFIFESAQRIDGNSLVATDDAQLVAALCELVARVGPSSDDRVNARGRRAVDMLDTIGPEAVPGICQVYLQARTCPFRQDLLATILKHARLDLVPYLLGLLPAAEHIREAEQIARCLVSLEHQEPIGQLLEIAARPEPTHVWRACTSALAENDVEASLLNRWLAWFRDAARATSPELNYEVLSLAVESADRTGSGPPMICELIALAGDAPIASALWPMLEKRAGPQDADQLAQLAVRLTESEAVQRIVDRLREFDTPEARRCLVAGARSEHGPFQRHCLKALCDTSDAIHVLPQLRKALAEAAEDDLPAITRTLLRLGDDEGAAGILDTAMRSEPPRSAILWAALERTCPPKLAEQVLTQCLDKPATRMPALKVLGRAGPANTPAAISSLLGGASEPEVRLAASRALERFSRRSVPGHVTGRATDVFIGTDTYPLSLDTEIDDAMPSPVACQHSDHFSLKEWLGPEGAAAALALALDDDDAAVRASSAAALTNLGRLSESLRLELLQSGPARARQALEQASERYGEYQIQQKG